MGRSKLLTARMEVTKSARGLALPESRFRMLSVEEAAPLLAAIESRFVEKPGRRWWWEAFRAAPMTRAHFQDGSGWQCLVRVVPPGCGRVWFVIEDHPGFILCEATIEAIQSVISDCSPFEYYVVSQNLDWLVCENHSDVVYAIGEAVTGRLTQETNSYSR